jgi:hypothetical protein
LGLTNLSAVGQKQLDKISKLGLDLLLAHFYWMGKKSWRRQSGHEVGVWIARKIIRIPSHNKILK